MSQGLLAYVVPLIFCVVRLVANAMLVPCSSEDYECLDWLVVLSSDSHQNVQCTLCGFHLHYELFSMFNGKSINVHS